jgi:hypothetical protein
VTYFLASVIIQFFKDRETADAVIETAQHPDNRHKLPVLWASRQHVMKNPHLAAHL